MSPSGTTTKETKQPITDPNTLLKEAESYRQKQLSAVAKSIDKKAQQVHDDLSAGSRTSPASGQAVRVRPTLLRFGFTKKVETEPTFISPNTRIPYMGALTNLHGPLFPGLIALLQPPYHQGIPQDPLEVENSNGEMVSYIETSEQQGMIEILADVSAGDPTATATNEQTSKHLEGSLTHLHIFPSSIDTDNLRFISYLNVNGSSLVSVQANDQGQYPNPVGTAWTTAFALMTVYPSIGQPSSKIHKLHLRAAYPGAYVLGPQSLNGFYEISVDLPKSSELSSLVAISVTLLVNVGVRNAPDNPTEESNMRINCNLSSHTNVFQGAGRVEIPAIAVIKA